jgi:hypothetical protein
MDRIERKLTPLSITHMAVAASVELRDRIANGSVGCS